MTLPSGDLGNDLKTMMFETDKRERARCIREAALGFDDATARTMEELADELEAQASSEERAPPPASQPAA